jgi:hypothetical protein
MSTSRDEQSQDDVLNAYACACVCVCVCAVYV